MHRIHLILLCLLLLNSSLLMAQKKQKEDWKSSPLAMHDKLISQANSKRFGSWVLMLAGTSITLGGIAKYISPATANWSNSDPRLIWLPAVGILTTVASIPMSNSAKKTRKKAYAVLEGSAYLGNQKIPITRYPALGIKIDF